MIGPGGFMAGPLRKKEIGIVLPEEADHYSGQDGLDTLATIERLRLGHKEASVRKHQNQPNLPGVE